MSKKVRNYVIVCPSCKGAGYIDNPHKVSSQATIVCLACYGSKTVLVTESEDSNCEFLCKMPKEN
jgi:DnaJ-class molecular chaperone